MAADRNELGKTRGDPRDRKDTEQGRGVTRRGLPGRGRGGRKASSTGRERPY